MSSYGYAHPSGCQYKYSGAHGQRRGSTCKRCAGYSHGAGRAGQRNEEGRTLLIELGSPWSNLLGKWRELGGPSLELDETLIAWFEPDLDDSLNYASGLV